MLTLLIVLALLTLVVSVALIAVLLSRDDGAPASTVAAPTLTPAGASATVESEATSTSEPFVAPAIPLDLQSRIDALPLRLRDRALEGFSTGGLDLSQLEQIVSDFENRNPNLRVGAVVSTADGVLRFEVFTTGEQATVNTFEQTRIVRAGKAIGLQDLVPTELVMVVSAEDGLTALTIEAFGVAEP